MSSTKPLLLLLGAGANIGQAVEKNFLNSGYRVVTAARSLQELHPSPDTWSYKIDLKEPNAVTEIFSKVFKDIGIPNVVIYNAASLTFPPDGHPLSVPVKDIETSLNINTVSMYAAAQQAVLGFEKLPEEVLKSFIYTGNMLNTSPMPMLISLGVGKAASAHIIESAARAYAEKKYRFFYVDERKEDGSPMGTAVNGEAHAEHFLNLADGTKSQPWLSTFVAGKGYVKFG